MSRWSNPRPAVGEGSSEKDIVHISRLLHKLTSSAAFMSPSSGLHYGARQNFSCNAQVSKGL